MQMISYTFGTMIVLTAETSTYDTLRIHSIATNFATNENQLLATISLYLVHRTEIEMANVISEREREIR